jgi:hypothetical protein
MGSWTKAGMRAGFFVPSIIAGVLLAACGGGGSSGGAPASSGSGSSGGSGGTGSGGGTTSESLTVPQNKTVTSSTSASPYNYEGPVTVTGAPASSTFYYTVSFTGSAIASMTMEGAQSTTYGITAPTGSPAGRISGEPSPGVGATITGSFGPTNDIAFALIPPAEMGAGTYTDTITITVCNDAKCASPVTGSPAKILITYIVTGNPIPNTLFTPENASFTLEAPTSSASAPITTTTITTINLPPTGAYVFTSIGTGVAVASATLQSNLNGTGTLTITGKPPASLGSGVYQDSVEVKVCFDAACTKPAAHTPFTFPVTYVVDASANVDFTVQTIPLQLFEMYRSSVNQRIYATSPSYAATNPNSLLVINPATASVETVVPLGTGTGVTNLALSDDGQYAYVYEDVPMQVVRVNLSTMSVDETIATGGLEGTNVIKVPPGLPTSLAVQPIGNSAILEIFDGTVLRAQTFTAVGAPGHLPFTFGTDATTMFAYSATPNLGTMYQLGAGSAGFTQTQSATGLDFNESEVDDLAFTNGLVYSSTGNIFNPATNAAGASFSMQNTNTAGTTVWSWGFAIDSTLNRAYFLTNDNPQGQDGDFTLQGFNLTTQAPTWITRFPSDQIGSTIVRWGSNGLAFVTNSQGVYSLNLLSGSVVAR